jgi:Mrp family chromosome partitioning ATPase
VPLVPRRGRRRHLSAALEQESYQTLGAAVRFALPSDSRPHLLLVTSALQAEGKSTVTARLGRALAGSGHRTLLVSADLRRPTVHELFDLPAEPGVADLLVHLEQHGDDGALDRMLLAAIATRRVGGHGEVGILPSGRVPAEPARLLGGAGVDRLLERLGALGYAYVLIDAPPLLGLADAQELARRVPHLLYVGRLDLGHSVDQAIEARDLLDRLEARPIGLVVIGARSEPSPYYTGLASRPLGAA